MFAGYDANAHAPRRPQVVHQLFLQYPRVNDRLRDKCLVGTRHALLLGFKGLQPSEKSVRADQSSISLLATTARNCGAGRRQRFGRNATPAGDRIVGTISRTTTMASDLPANRRGGSFQGRAISRIDDQRAILVNVFSLARVSDNRERRRAAGVCRPHGQQYSCEMVGCGRPTSAPNLVLDCRTSIGARSRSFRGGKFHRFRWIINTTFEQLVPRWCCIDLLNHRGNRTSGYWNPRYGKANSLNGH